MHDCGPRWSRRPGCMSTDCDAALCVRRTHEGRTVTDMPTQVVMLGTGNPRPEPDRSGPATAIVVDDTPYLIDFGPGVVRRMTAAFEQGDRGARLRRRQHQDGVPHPPAFRPHGRLSRSHLHALGDGAERAARGLRSEGHQGHDGAHPRGVADRHRLRAPAVSTSTTGPVAGSTRRKLRQAPSIGTATSPSRHFRHTTRKWWIPSAIDSRRPIARS